MEHTVSSNISHSGIIDSISEGMVRVRIVQSSSCSTCKVASYCSSSESKEKFIDVKCNNTSKYKVGQKVLVCTDTSNGAKAVILAFVIPAVLLLVAVAASLHAGMTEGYAALMGIAILIPYYLAIYFLNDTLRKELTFTITPDK